MYNCKNFSDNGGDRLVIGGELKVLDGAVVTGVIPAATAVEAIATPTEATASVCAEKINAIITALQNAGLMETPSST